MLYVGLSTTLKAPTSYNGGILCTLSVHGMRVQSVHLAKYKREFFMNMVDQQSGAHYHHSWLTPILLVSAVALALSGCPQRPTEEPQPDLEPSLVMSSTPVCSELILPKTDLTQEGAEPTFLPIEVRFNGVSGSIASQYSVKLTLDPDRTAGCLLSSVEDESGQISSYRCETTQSAPLSFVGGRAYDNFYCTGLGPFSITATVEFGDEEKEIITSNSLEVVCLAADVFENNCERPEEPMPDMDVLPDMDMLSDMEVIPDMDLPDVPAAWSIVFTPDQEAELNLSVQGSNSAYPKNGTYQFSVLDERGQGIRNVPVKFFLDWSPLEEYDLCDPLCTELSDQESCEGQNTCEWVEMAPEEAGADGAGADGAGQAAGEVNAGDDAGAEARPLVGACQRNGMTAGRDERCSGRTDRCQANICLPSDLSSLPVAIEPMRVRTDATGTAQVSLVTSDQPGVFSVRAEAEFEGRIQVAHTPNFTIFHQIPSQREVSLRCTSPVIAGFAHRYAPDINRGTDSQGYLQYQRESTDCFFQAADRFSGRVSDFPVFFMSEAGNITQATASNEMDVAIGTLSVGGRSPFDVEPITWALPNSPQTDLTCQSIPLVNQPGEGCGLEETRLISVQNPATGSPAELTFNPTDGLIRVIAHTQGEARFIDYDSDPDGDGDGLYNPDQDLVPAHPEPFVDANDNGEFDSGEYYHDVNRDGQWNADVFGREEEDLEILRCLEDTLARLSQGLAPNNQNCVVPDDIESLARDNPASLQATIWTSTNVLSVGLPWEDRSDAYIAQCLNGDCGQGATPGNFACDPLGQADFYLAAGGILEFAFNPKDEQHNCVGLEGVSIKFDVEGMQFLSATPNLQRTFNQTGVIPGTTISPRPEECFDRGRPRIPKSHTYKFAIMGDAIASDQPDFKVGVVKVTLTVPDYQVGDGQPINFVYTKTVGVCQ